jgi:regulation of enolase protein 1 (concanavalin A-like superfamily)
MSRQIIKTLQVFLSLGLVFVAGAAGAQSLTKFKSEDIGNPALKGEATFVKSGVDIQAGGEDIWGNSDQFHFVFQKFSGDFDIAVRLEALEQSHLYTKAGLMAREDLTSGSRSVMFLAFPGNAKRNNNRGGYEFQYRAETGKQSKAIYPSLTDSAAQASFPVNYPNGWMRLKRVGKSFSAFTSTDGQIWKLYTEFVMEMPKELFFGMAVTAHIKGAATVAKFRNYKSVK